MQINEVNPALDELRTTLKEELGIARLERDPVTLYHYCTAAGMLGICQSQCFWATHLRFMNDPEELRFARELFDRVVHPNHSDEQREADRQGERPMSETRDRSRRPHDPHAPRIYNVSFSEIGEDLNGWRIYGDNSHGYALAFSPSRFSLDIPRRALVQVIYDEHRQRRLIDHWLRVVEGIQTIPPSDLERECGLDPIRTLHELMRWRDLLLASFKRSHYSSEKEWRLIQIVESAQEFPQKYVIRDRQPRPYIELPLVPYPKGPVEGIIVGSNVSEDVIDNVILPLCRITDEPDHPWYKVSRIRTA